MANLSGVPTIDLQNIKSSNKYVPKIIVRAVPIIFLLIEWIYSKLYDTKTYEKKEAFASICVGIGNIFIYFLLNLALLSRCMTYCRGNFIFIDGLCLWHLLVVKIITLQHLSG
jgi:hypothetical protein